MMVWVGEGTLWGRFRTAPITTMFIPGTPPANHPPTEACMIHSKQHRGCRSQGPGTRGYRGWKTADFSHSAGTAHGAPPVQTRNPEGSGHKARPDMRETVIHTHRPFANVDSQGTRTIRCGASGGYPAWIPWRPLRLWCTERTLPTHIVRDAGLRAIDGVLQAGFRRNQKSPRYRIRELNATLRKQAADCNTTKSEQKALQ